MFSRLWGNGDALVAGIHGWAGDHRAFEPLVPHLPHDARLLAFDLPGFGQSPAPAQYDLHALGRAIADEITRAGFEHLTLVSSCAGAYPMLLAARHLPHARLVMIDAFAYAPLYFRAFTNRAWGHHAYRATFANPLGRRLTNAGLARGDMTRSFHTVDHAAALAFLRACQDLGGHGQFADIRLPLTLAHGERTFGAVRRSIPMWCENWPHAQVVELRGAAHLAITEAPAQVAALVFNQRPEPAMAGA